MIPVDQEYLEGSCPIGGDCVRASVASLLELPRDDVPHFVHQHGDAWQTELLHWLEDRRLYGLRAEGDPLRAPFYYLGFGGSPNGPRRGHAVVMRNGRVAHDPNPSRKGLLGLHFTIIVLPKGVADRRLGPLSIPGGAVAKYVPDVSSFQRGAHV